MVPDATGNVTITSVTNATTAGTCTGNAASATKLATARTINGVAFDGSAAITISAAASVPSYLGIGDITIRPVYGVGISSGVVYAGGTLVYESWDGASYIRYYLPVTGSWRVGEVGTWSYTLVIRVA